MAGFDERCPHCNELIQCYDKWVDHDHQSFFVIECECGKRVEINVEMTPVFETCKVMCAKCGKKEPDGPHYCSKCFEQIVEHERKSKVCPHP